MSINIPNFDFANDRFVDEKGKLHPGAFQGLMELFTQLQSNYNKNGIQIPFLSGAEITAIEPQASNGVQVYNTDTHKGMICENGTFKTITTS